MLVLQTKSTTCYGKKSRRGWASGSGRCEWLGPLVVRFFPQPVAPERMLKFEPTLPEALRELGREIVEWTCNALEFAEVNTRFSNRKNWEQVRRGNQYSLHMLASQNDPANNHASLVVDFGHIVSLPIDFLGDYADSLGDGWRLTSPFLEHFSQAFARFFMRPSVSDFFLLIGDGCTLPYPFPRGPLVCSASNDRRTSSRVPMGTNIWYRYWPG